MLMNSRGGTPFWRDEGLPKLPRFDKKKLTTFFFHDFRIRSTLQTGITNLYSLRFDLMLVQNCAKIVMFQIPE